MPLERVLGTSPSSVITRGKIRRSDTGQGLTGLSSTSTGLIISTITDNEAAATTYTQAGSTIETITTLGTYAAPTATKCRFKEVDSTNHPGVYEFQFADARWQVASAKTLRVSVTGPAALLILDRDFLYQITIDGNVQTINSVATTSVTAVNANVGTTQPVNFTGTAGSALVKGDAVDIAGAAVSTSSAQVGVNAVQVGGTAAATAIGPAFTSGAVATDAGNSATQIKTNLSESTDDYWKDALIVLTSGAMSGQVKKVTAYNGTSKTLTFGAFTGTPADGVTFLLINR